MPSMVDGVNKVSTDGRFKLPPELAERYEGDYLKIEEVRTGEIMLKVVE